MSNLDRIWKLYMAYKKTETPEQQRGDWGYYSEGYAEAKRQEYALAAKRKEKRTQEAAND
jgi:hypothetical protein